MHAKEHNPEFICMHKRITVCRPVVHVREEANVVPVYHGAGVAPIAPIHPVSGIQYILLVILRKENNKHYKKNTVAIST